METIKVSWYPNPIDSTPERLCKEYGLTYTKTGVEEYDVTGKEDDIDAFFECADGLDLIDWDRQECED
jgi:hypothetical protein